MTQIQKFAQYTAINESKEDTLIDAFLDKKVDLTKNLAAFKRAFKSFKNGKDKYGKDLYDIQLTKEQADKFGKLYSYAHSGGGSENGLYKLEYHFKDTKVLITSAGNGINRAADWYDKAIEWRAAHLDKVKELIAADDDLTKAYTPSKEDLNQPNLWKGAHWRWFREHIKSRR